MKDSDLLDKFKAKMEIDFIVSGGADGTDTFAEDWAKKNNLSRIIFCPNWKRFGKQAAAIRNQKIVDNSDEIVIFWDGESKGTAITMQMAKKAKKPFHLIFSGTNPKKITDALDKKCAFCGKENILISYGDEKFKYGVGETAVELTANMPVYTCQDCKESYTDCNGEDAREQAVKEHLLKNN